MIRGILFDIDGVIVDSEPFLAEACRLFFEKRGCAVKAEDFLPYVGAGENKYIGCVAEKYGIPIEIEAAKIEVYQIYRQVANGETGFGKMPAMPGITAFVENARKAGLKMALASSADKMKVEINLESAGFSTSDFDFIISGSQLKRKKPFGDIYVYSALQLGLSPDECVVVEDAINGVMAAKAAQCSCIAVTGSFPEDKLRAKGADLVYQNLLSFPRFDSIESFNQVFEKQVKKQMMAAFPESLKFIVAEHAAGILSESYSVYCGECVTLESSVVSPLISALSSFISEEGRDAKIHSIALKKADLSSILQIKSYCTENTRLFITGKKLRMYRISELLGDL